MSFVTAPVRVNGGRIVASWWNTLRTAGAAIEGFLGAAFIGATDFTIANNQSAEANVTGLSFSGTSVRAFFVEYTVYRNTTGGGAAERAQSGTLVGAYSTVAASWEMTEGQTVGDAGVVLTITAAGQVQYTSDSQAGTPATSKMTFTAKTIAV